MSSSASDIVKPTCQHRRSNGDFCKRSVHEGEALCWQHAVNWSHRWKALTRNQAVGFFGLLLGLLATIGFGWAGVHYSPTKEDIAKEVVKELPLPPRQHDVEKPIAETLKTEDTVTSKKKKAKGPTEAAPAVNNLPSGSITQGPGSITQLGGVGNTATVNNFALPDRRLDDNQVSILVACLKAHPGKFEVGSIANNNEAYRYALDWYETFKAAGWKPEPEQVQIFMIGGGMWSGLHVDVHGGWDSASNRAVLEPGAPETSLQGCLNNAHVGGVMTPYPDTPTGTVRVWVSDRPRT